MLYHLILGLKYIHESGIIHRDLKPANVMINADCSIKIYNFSTARGINEIIKENEKKKQSRYKKKKRSGMIVCICSYFDCRFV